MMNMKYDVVIIGSGLGGLICGSLLAREGKKVLVLDRQAQPGGCMQSYQRDGLSFDTGFHYVGGLAEGHFLHNVFSYLGLMQLPWVRLDADGFDQVTIGQHTFPLAEGYDHFSDTLSEYFPREREALKQYVELMRHLPPMEEIGSVNAYNWLTSLFHDPLLINVLSGSAIKMELCRESTSLFTFAHSMSSYIGSSWRLRGGGHLIVDALVNDISRLGGRVVCHAEVNKMVEKEGRIVAIRCMKGNIYEGNVFISDVHPQLTFQWLGESRLLKKTFRRRINAMENSFGMFTASLVLKKGVLPYFNHNKYVYRKPNVWTFHEDEGGIGGVMVSCRVPETGNDARQIDLMTPVSWKLFESWADTSVGRRGEIYEMLKNHLADECIRLAERVIPGLRGMVEKCYTSTPLTYRDYTLTPFGSAYGVRKDCRNMMLTTLAPRTLIPNLLLTGQSLILHGVEGVTMTALLTCGELLGKDYIHSMTK
jgi:phytoene dehydrogenase-like protein